MNEAIEALPRTLKDVLILRDVEGVESQEVCELLKITETNLYVRLHRARERVRRAVEIYLDGVAHAVEGMSERGDSEMSIIGGPPYGTRFVRTHCTEHHVPRGRRVDLGVPG